MGGQLEGGLTAFSKNGVIEIYFQYTFQLKLLSLDFPSYGTASRSGSLFCFYVLIAIH